MADTTTQATGVPAWAEPYFKNYLATAQNVAAMPYQGFGGQTVAQLNPYQTQAYNAQAQRALQGSPVTDAASAELQKTLSGGYLGSGNPYLTGMIDAASQDVTRNYNQSVIPQLTALDARSGSFGNSGVASATGTAQGQLAQQLGNVATNIRGNDYAAERGRMLGAVGMAPSIANQDYLDVQQLGQAGFGFQQQDQANLTDQQKRFNEARAYPQQQLGIMGTALGRNYGTTSTTTEPSQNPFATGLGTAATLYGASNLGGAGSKSPTVICTELHAQGRMSNALFELDQQFGADMALADPDVMTGYYRLAMPVVRLMRRSSFVSAAVALLALPWAREMARLRGYGSGSLIGAGVMWLGVPLCRAVGRRHRSSMIVAGEF